MSVALLLRNNPKRRKSNFRSPAPPPPLPPPPPPAHDLFWANLRVQPQLPPLDLAWNPVYTQLMVMMMMMMVMMMMMMMVMMVMMWGFMSSDVGLTQLRSGCDRFMVQVHSIVLL